MNPPFYPFVLLSLTSQPTFCFCHTPRSVLRDVLTPKKNSTAKNKLGKVLYGNMYREIKSGAACNTLMEAYISRKKRQDGRGAETVIDTKLPPFLRQNLPALAQRKRGRKTVAAVAAATVTADADDVITATASISASGPIVSPKERPLGSPTTDTNADGILPPILGPVEINVSAGTPHENDSVSLKGKRLAKEGRRIGGSSKPKQLRPLRKGLVDEPPASPLGARFSKMDHGSASDTYVGGQHRQKNRRQRRAFDGNQPVAGNGMRKQRKGGETNTTAVVDYSSAPGGMFSLPARVARRRRRNVTTSASLATLTLGPTDESPGCRRKNAAIDM